MRSKTVDEALHKGVTIYELDMHAICYVDDGITAMRVPGGLIYNYCHKDDRLNEFISDGLVFVPFIEFCDA